MKNNVARLLLVLLCLQPLSAQYRTAQPGYRYSFPRDHFNHPDFQTEWWYYTGNLQAVDGHRFGFELTFFRQAVRRDSSNPGTWDVQDIYFAHLALSDLDGRKFYHAERTNRSGPGIAGIDQPTGRIWNGNWQVLWNNRNDDQELQAASTQFQLHFTMHSEKPPVIHGQNGISRKAEGPGHASHYISLTRLATRGSVELSGKKFDVTGYSWMDHEFFTQQLSAGQIGWDWVSAQFDDHTELMLFRIRSKDGSIDPFSAGTFVDPKGNSKHVTSNEFTFEASGETWTSPTTHAVYPVRWNIAVPALGLRLEIKTDLPSQELTAGTAVTPNYWEGAIVLSGKEGARSLTGTGYLEMTGYDRPLEITRQ